MLQVILLSLGLLNPADRKASVSENHVICFEDTCGICIPKALNLHADSTALFHPYGKDLSWFKMEIRSRWGDVVFSGRENQPWNGRDKKGNNLPSGTYYYSINVINRDARKEEKVGVVSLYR